MDCDVWHYGSSVLLFAKNAGCLHVLACRHTDMLLLPMINFPDTTPIKPVVSQTWVSHFGSSFHQFVLHKVEWKPFWDCCIEDFEGLPLQSIQYP